MTFEAMLTPAQRSVRERLRVRDAAERAAGTRTGASLKALAPEVAELLFSLALARRACVIAELGTSHGYSTLHLAAAAERTDGHVYSVDVLAEKTTAAQENLTEAGLLHRVTLATADCAEWTASLPSAIDLALVDVSLPAFLPACDALLGRLAPGGAIFIDGGPDGYWDAGESAPVRARLESDARLAVTLVPMRKLHVLAVRLPD